MLCDNVIKVTKERLCSSHKLFPFLFLVFMKYLKVWGLGLYQDVFISKIIGKNTTFFCVKYFLRVFPTLLQGNSFKCLNTITQHSDVPSMEHLLAFSFPQLTQLIPDNTQRLAVVTVCLLLVEPFFFLGLFLSPVSGSGLASIVSLPH